MAAGTMPSGTSGIERRRTPVARSCPATEFRAGAQLPDDQLAACLRVPVVKIADRRAELTAAPDRPRSGRLCAELEPGPGRHVAQPSNGRKHRQRTRRTARR